jgi:hypothetical protein
MARLAPFASLLLVAVLSLPSTARAQPAPDTTVPDSVGIPELLERLLDERSTEAPTEQLVERLTRLATSPLDLNRASAASLSTLPGISPPLAHRIIEHRSDSGPFSSVDDLARVDGVDADRLRTLRPFLQARPPPDASDPSPYSAIPSLPTVTSNLDFELIQRATRDLDLGRGYADDTSRTTFEGSPLRLTTRLRLHYDRRVELGLTLDKDPGEPLHWAPESNTYGFDHIAGSLALRDMGRLQTLVLGDFTVQFGQGLALWQGLSFGKGRDPVSSLMREGRGVVPFSSTSENGYFRGAAATVALTPSLSVTGFASRRHRDASLDSSAVDAPSAPVPARTLSSGGRHRTPSEIARKNTFGTTTVGGAGSYRSDRIHLGLVGYHSQFDRPLRPGNQAYRRFDVSGTRTFMMSAFATGYLDDYVLFGEVARAKSGALGALVGAGLDHQAGLEAVVLARRYPRSFAGLFNGAFGDGGTPQNEMGLYTGLRLQVAPNWWISGYLDQYQSSWLQFGVPRPASGLDTRLLVETTPRPWLSTYVQVRAERSADGTEHRGPHGRRLSGLQERWHHSARWHLEYDFSDRLTLRTRVAATRAGSSVGVLFYQGVGLQLRPSLELDARIAVFDSDDFASRLYAYEHDLLYSFSVPALFDQGHRSYVLLQYDPFPSLSISAKYGVTWYPHRDTIGSGLNARAGNRDREVRLQFRWTL